MAAMYGMWDGANMAPSGCLGLAAGADAPSASGRSSRLAKLCWPLSLGGPALAVVSAAAAVASGQ
ncbi:hypothetical protein PENSUB_6296 [Penicillium subrubescens]|uniref:Uncharacterized protein n=1 Tax=Penicillium subrubescens TaxID=1316194 RepID=A0A1Q5U1F0_9EURO|nr:hypothetical protein PENSUB_6296 [Penicillium subrubescens]